jgi:uncharacterized protein YfbU (UPF0304 family)
MTLAEEKTVLERIRLFVEASQGVSLEEVSAAFDEMGSWTCRRLLTLLVGQGVITQNFEPRSNRKNGLPNRYQIFRARKK